MFCYEPVSTDTFKLREPASMTVENWSRFPLHRARWCTAQSALPKSRPTAPNTRRPPHRFEALDHSRRWGFENPEA